MIPTDRVIVREMHALGATGFREGSATRVHVNDRLPHRARQAAAADVLRALHSVPDPCAGTYLTITDALRLDQLPGRRVLVRPQQAMIPCARTGQTAARGAVAAFT